MLSQLKSFLRYLVPRPKRLLFIASLIFLLVISSKLGRFLDITQSPKQVDIIVCLGGGWVERLDKTSQIYKLGFSKENKIILTGTLIGKLSENDLHGFYKIPYLKKKGIDESEIIFAKKTYTTYQEVQFVKNYMIKNDYKSVIFVSDPPHSKRIQYSANSLKYSDNNLSCMIVGSDVSWWNKDNFYRNLIAIKMSIKELGKLLYYLVKL